jgi:hypothetical protein
VEYKLRSVHFRRVSDPRRGFRPAFRVTGISDDCYRSIMGVSVIGLETPRSAGENFEFTCQHLGVPAISLGAPTTSLGAPGSTSVKAGYAGDKSRCAGDMSWGSDDKPWSTGNNSGSTSNHSRAVWEKQDILWEPCWCTRKSKLLHII